MRSPGPTCQVGVVGGVDEVMVERLRHVVVQQQLVLGQHAVLWPTEKPYHALGGQLAWGTGVVVRAAAQLPGPERTVEGQKFPCPHPSAR